MFKKTSEFILVFVVVVVVMFLFFSLGGMLTGVHSSNRLGDWCTQLIVSRRPGTAQRRPQLT